MTSDMTTVKVRKATRALIADAARDDGSTIDAFLARLVTEHLWRERLDRARELMAHPDPAYRDEIEAWDVAAADGLR